MGNVIVPILAVLGEISLLVGVALIVDARARRWFADENDDDRAIAGFARGRRALHDAERSLP